MGSVWYAISLAADYLGLGELVWSNWWKANLVLQDTVERLYAGNLYADIPRGVFLVRGENVLLLGEIVRLSYPCLLIS